MPRDIIGESFKKYVEKQIDVRQSALGQYRERDPDLLKYINNNTSWIRLSSGVNITYEKAKELGVTNFSGDLLAKKSVLFSARKYENYSAGNFAGDFTHGVGYNLQNPSYGYTPAIGLAGNDLTDLDIVKYGLVPPPGIISAEIKSLNRGSLREATVEIVCHNLAQFRIIEALYLKLKFSMFLEWGHTLWYDNSGTLRSDMPDWIHQGFLNGDYDQDKLLELLEQQRELFCGNYDGYLGYVRNFDWSLRQDGGYNITLKLISIGDVIESLKLNMNYPGVNDNLDSNAKENQDKPPTIVSKNKSTINQILYAIRSEMDQHAEEGTINGFNNGGTSVSLSASEIVRMTKNNSQFDLIQPNYFDPKEVTDWDKASNILVYQEVIRNKYYSLIAEEDGDIVEGYFYYMKLGSLLRIIESFLLKYDTSKVGENNTYKPIFYIDHDFDTNLCLTIPNQGSTNPLICLLKPSDNAAQGGGGGTASATTTYTKFTYLVKSDIFGDKWIQKEPTQIGVTADDPNFDSFDAYIIKYRPNEIPGGQSEPDKFDKIEFYEEGDSSNTYLTTSGNTTFYFDDYYYLYLPENGGVSYNTEEEIEVAETWWTTSWMEGASSTVDNARNLSGLGDYFRVSGYPFLGKFIHIHVNLDYIATTLANNIDEEGKISLYAFLTQLMKGIADATGQINTFEVVYDDLTNYFYIVDSNTLPGAGEYLQRDTVPSKINVNLLTSNEGSFVKEVSIKSELDNKFAATISIGAQANGNKVGENSTALSKLNVGYTDRIIKEKSSIIDVQTEEDATTDSSGSISPQQAYANNLIQYTGIINKIQLGTITQDDIASGTEGVVDLFKYQLGYFTQQGNIGGVGFIPINLQLTMKGLSGPRIYESYTINDEILPDNYKKNIQFITKGISHKISDNEWTTTLESLSGPLQSKLKPIGDENFIIGEDTTPTPDNDNNNMSSNTSKATSSNNTGKCKRKSAYPDLPVVPYVKTYISDDEVMRILKPNFSKEVALAVFAIMKNEQGEGDRFRGFNNNYGGVQTDSGKWSNDDVITGRLCLKDGSGEFREFASFNNADESIKFKANKIKNFGIYIGGTPKRFDDNPWVDKELPYINAVSTTYGYEWIRSSAGIEDGRWQKAPFLEKMEGYYKKAEKVYNKV